MSRYRFEFILKYLQFSTSDDLDEQVTDFINALNRHMSNVLSPGDVVCMDESMIKSFHEDLKGMIKIIRKTRPISNEIKY